MFNLKVIVHRTLKPRTRLCLSFGHCELNLYSFSFVVYNVFIYDYMKCPPHTWGFFLLTMYTSCLGWNLKYDRTVLTKDIKYIEIVAVVVYRLSELMVLLIISGRKYIMWGWRNMIWRKYFILLLSIICDMSDDQRIQGPKIFFSV